MLIIRNAQIEVFRATARNAFVDDMVAHLQGFAGRHCQVIGESGVRAVVTDGLGRAEAHGFTQRGPAQLYIELMFTFGSSFDSDPQLAWAASALSVEDGADAMLRANRLYDAAVHWLEAIAGPGNSFTLAALTRLNSVAEQPLGYGRDRLAEGLLTQLHQAYPEKASAVGDAGLLALIARARTSAEAFGMGTFRGEILFCVLMFVMGHGFAQDALYPWVVRVVNDARSAAQPEGRVQRLERHALTYLSGVVAHFGLVRGHV